MKDWKENRDFLREIPLPTATESYTPIPHAIFLDEMSDELVKCGYKIIGERYLTANRGQIMTGSYIIDGGRDGLNPSIIFTNSYNKVRRASMRAGANVLVCKNGMMGLVTIAEYKRMHTGAALEDVRSNISVVVNSLKDEFERLAKNMDEMKGLSIKPMTVSKLVGDMYLNEGLIREEQLSILKNELKNSINFAGDTLWDFYNNCTEAFKNNHPMEFDKQHIKLHTYLSDIFELTGARGLFKKDFFD